MKYYVTLKDREYEVEIREAEGRLEGILDGRVWDLDCSVIDEGSKYSVVLGHESLNVTVKPDTNSLDLIIGGHLYQTSVLDERERGALALESRRAAAGGVVKSVMPGIVRRIFVEEGQEVEAGAPLLILEAMKMENEIAAEGGGRVACLHVKEGDAVNAHDPLVTMSCTAE